MSHNSPPCGDRGGQVVGYRSNTPEGAANAPAWIIQNWFDSPSHYAVLTFPTLNNMSMGFVTIATPGGGWTVFGVGNLCP